MTTCCTCCDGYVIVSADLDENRVTQGLERDKGFA
jgi:hypothetical protein